MKTKLTLRIDSASIKVKRISRKNGISISQMVEQFLQNIIDQNNSNSAVIRLSGIGGNEQNRIDGRRSNLKDYA